MIRIWKFADAPAHLKLHPHHPSDANRVWVMEVPVSMCHEVEAILHSFLGSPTDFFRDELPNRAVVFSGLYPRSCSVELSQHETKSDAS